MHRLLCLALALFVSGCAEKQAVEADSVQGLVGKEGSFLAYEHTVALSIPPELLPGRMALVREACADQRFGPCSVLTFEEETGDYPSGVLVARLAPDSVKPLVALGSEGAKTTSYTTRAEDVSVDVGEVDRERDELQLQSEMLRDLQSKGGLTAGDLVALTSELSKIATRLAELDGASAKLSHRIETNLLTVRYSSMSEVSVWARIVESVLESGESFGDGVVEVVDLIAYGIPFLFVAFPLALLWRWAWRRATGNKAVLKT